MPTILLAIDAYTPLDRLLPAAVLLAAQQHGELVGVFSQDSRLLRGAALSCTQEVGANSAACYPVTSESIEKRIKRIADDMRQRLAQAAERQQLRWEFQQRLGSISQITAETNAEIVLPGWSESQWAGSTHSFLSTHKAPAKPAIVVIDDGSSLSAQIIETARVLAGTKEPQQLIVLAVDSAIEVHPARQENRADRRSAEIRIPVASLDELNRQLRLLRPTLTLLGRGQPLAAVDRLQRELAFIRCPVAIVRPTE